MPLTVSVGLSREANENDQSATTSITLTADLDRSLSCQPEELQAGIREFCELARAVLDEQEGQQRSERPALACEPTSGRGGLGQQPRRRGKAADREERTCPERRRRRRA
jgi:hypothetical protein